MWYGTGKWNCEGDKINIETIPEYDLNPILPNLFDPWKVYVRVPNFSIKRSDLGVIKPEHYISIAKVDVDDIENYWSLLATKEYTFVY